MSSGAGISGAVVVVRDLDRSEAFYRELLELDVEASSAEAVLLSSRGGDRLVLRRLSAAPHVSGGIGVLFVVWTADTARRSQSCRERPALPRGLRLAFGGRRVGRARGP
jgi:catechol 2,3-dioxygenase-like lactoylglutathione lyase family enzyme